MAQPHASQFSGIFVSYRRDDTAGHAGRLFDNLSKHFGENQIFMDIDTIEPGEDFVEVIEKAVGSCEIVIAVMGKSWLSSSDGEFRRLDNPNDFVRLEIATALKRGIRVIPVLVQKATMPRPHDLPDDIATLSRRNAIELSDSRWQYDVTKLVTVLERVLAARQEARAAEAAKQEEEERLRQEEEQSRRAEEEARRRLAAEEIARKAAEERRREEEEKERQALEEQRRAEEEKKRLAAEAEERRLKAERIRKAKEKRRAEEETRQRLAEEAERHADEQRRIEEEKEQKALEAKRREEESQRRLAEETAKREAAEEKRLVEEKALEEKRRTEQAAQRRLAEEAAKRRAAEEKRAVEVEATRRVADEEAKRQVTEKKQQEARAKAEAERAGKFVEASSAGARPFEISPEVPAPTSREPIPARSTPEFAEALAEPETKSRKTILIITVAATVVLVIVMIVFMLNTPNKSKQVAPNVNPLALYPPSGMVYVPGGEFTMGRNGDDPYESPAHKVNVKPFFMDVYEVTCEDFQKFLKNHTAAGDESKQCDGRDGKIPVTGVTWDDANAYAKSLGKRLPTEAEWEFAARGTDERPYPWGFEWLPGRANAQGSSGLTRVGASSGASPFGAFDMVGNAWEWTSSSLVAYPGGKLPKAVFGDIKIIRGGSYDELATEATTTYRGFVKPAGEQDRYVKTGFRCVKDINQ